MYICIIFNVWIYIHICIYIYVYIRIYIYIYIYLFVYICIYIYIYIHVCVCVCVYNNPKRIILRSVRWRRSNLRWRSWASQPTSSRSSALCAYRCGASLLLTILKLFAIIVLLLWVQLLSFLYWRLGEPADLDPLIRALRLQVRGQFTTTSKHSIPYWQ